MLALRAPSLFGRLSTRTECVNSTPGSEDPASSSLQKPRTGKCSLPYKQPLIRPPNRHQRLLNTAPALPLGSDSATRSADGQAEQGDHVSAVIVRTFVPAHVIQEQSLPKRNHAYVHACICIVAPAPPPPRTVCSLTLATSPIYLSHFFSHSLAVPRSLFTCFT